MAKINRGLFKRSKRVIAQKLTDEILRRDVELKERENKLKDDTSYYINNRGYCQNSEEK